MYWDNEFTPEEENEIIKEIVEKIHSYSMEVPAILFLESVKPLTYIGSQMGRFFLSPFLPVFGDEIGLTWEKLIQVFERRENVEKIIEYLDLSKEENKQSERKNNEE